MKTGSGLQRQQGIGKFTLLFFGTLLFVAGFCVYHIAPFYYYYYELRSHMEQMIKVASTETDQEIRKRLMYYIKKYDLPVEPEELKIERDGRRMRISLKYSEVFYVSWQDKDYDIHTFHFHAFAQGDF